MKISSYFLLCFALTVAMACGAQSDQSARPAASFTGDFETGDISQWEGSEAARADSIQIVTDPVRRGRYAAKFTVRAGERVSNGNRAEIFRDHGDKAGREVWYAWSFLVPRDFVDVEWAPKLWQCIGQWHDQPDKTKGETWANFPGRSPSIAVYYTSKGGASAIEVWYGTYGKGEAQKIVARAPIVKGQWHDLRFHIRWSQGSDGFLEPFLDGRPLIASEKGRASGPNMWNGASHYLKIGLYRSDRITPTNSVYFDEVRIGPSRARVEIPARGAGGRREEGGGRKVAAPAREVERR